MASFISTLLLEAKQRLKNIQDYFPKKTKWEDLLNTLSFVAYGIIRIGSIQPPNKIICKCQALAQCRVPLPNFWERFELMPDANDEQAYASIYFRIN